MKIKFAGPEFREFANGNTVFINDGKEFSVTPVQWQYLQEATAKVNRDGKFEDANIFQFVSEEPEKDFTDNSAPESGSPEDPFNTPRPNPEPVLVPPAESGEPASDEPTENTINTDRVTPAGTQSNRSDGNLTSEIPDNPTVGADKSDDREINSDLEPEMVNES